MRCLQRCEGRLSATEGPAANTSHIAAFPSLMYGVPHITSVVPVTRKNRQLIFITRLRLLALITEAEARSSDCSFCRVAVSRLCASTHETVSLPPSAVDFSEPRLLHQAHVPVQAERVSLIGHQKRSSRA